MTDPATDPSTNTSFLPLVAWLPPRWGPAAGGLVVALLLCLGGPAAHAQEVKPLRSGTAQSEGDFGHSVDRVGDVTGDGHSDVVVGARDEAINFDGDGRVYVYSGVSGAEVGTFGSPNSTINGHFGGSVSYAGDLGGGAAPDVLVGASDENVNGINKAGAAYAFTSSGTLLRTFESPNIENDGSFGGSVNSIADLTGDGVREVLIGAPRETVGGLARAGRLYVMNGATGAPVHTLDSENPESDGDFGVSASSIGDVNGDGAPDVLVGANEETVNGGSGAGRAYLFSGATGAHLQTFTSPNPQLGDSFGGSDSVAGLGDVNGDGTPDVAVAAGAKDGAEFASGIVYVFNADGSLIYELPSPSPTFGGNFGSAIDDMPDTDNDGHADLVVSAKSEGTNGDNAGLAYLISGNDGSVISTLRSQNPESGAKFGWDVAYAGDTDGDNVPDVVTGALEEHVGGTADAGRAYLHTGVYFFTEAKSQKTVSSDGLVDFGTTGIDVNFASDSQPLPVELVHFDAQAAGDAVTLTWRTASETGNAGFRIQRQTESGAWRAVGRVDGAGTTTQVQSYRFEDARPPRDANRLTYRLAQVDTDGTRHYSDAVTVERTTRRLTLEAVYPNPARHRATIHYAVPEGADATLRLYDVLGRQVETVPLDRAQGRHTLQLSLDGLTNGTYFLQLSAGGHTRTRTLTVVQ